MFTKILPSLLILMTLTGPLAAEPAPTPESHLLLPYFEVSLQGLEQMTFFSIVNASEDELGLTATIYTNWAIPVYEVPIHLSGKEVLQVHLHDWIVSGKLPGGETICLGGETDCLELTHLQAALSGQPSTTTQLYYGSEFERGVATGFITIEADDGFLPESDVLWGDYFYTDPVQNFAQGQRLVRLEPNLSCADLCYRHSVRFLEGGGFSGGTKLTIWNWDGTVREPSEFPSPQFELEEAQIDVYSQDGELVDVIAALPVLPAQTLRVSDLGIRKPFGWLDLTTLESSTISGFYRAMGRYSVGVPSWCLPCNPCNENGPCYEPGHPGCSPPKCIPAFLQISGTTIGEVGKDFSMTYRVTGSPPIEVVVSDLPEGLIHEGSTISGIPAEAKNFTVTAFNDCDTHEITITIRPPTLSSTFLELVKEVINDDGGTATVADFPLFIDDLQVESGFKTPVSPGTYSVSEQNLPGYQAGTWRGDCTADGVVTLEPGDTKTCIITNDDRPAHLTLVKRVVNDDGGTARVRDFPLFVDGQPVTSGVATELPAGTYTASEQNLPGYIGGAWTGDCEPNGTVHLALGEDKTCVITNDDRPPAQAFLTLVKNVVNDDGGSAQRDDFPLFINAQQVASGQRVSLSPGSYVASEQNLPGYQAGSWTGDCAANGAVTLAEGDDKVCEITNNDLPATIALVKHVTNDHGGTAKPSDFALFIDGQPVTIGVAQEVSPGTHTASEQNLPGYQAGSWGGDCAPNGSVTLALGEHKVCEITNDDVCDSTPVFHVGNGQVAYNDPHRDYHHTEVSFDFSVGGEVDGEVQLFWRNGGSTYIKKRIPVSLHCGDPAFEGSLFWESGAKSHHPAHGATYSARLVVGGHVVESVPLN